MTTIGMFDNLIYLYENNLTRAIAVTVGLLIIIGMLLWISIIDIQKHYIKFKYMLIASSSIIIIPFIASFFCGCILLKWCILGSFILWFAFLFWNIVKNNDKFVGKADIDLLSALFSETIMFSVWQFIVNEEYPDLYIIKTWYSLFTYLLIGGIFYVILYLLIFTYKKIIKKQKLMQMIKETKVPVIPMFLPACIMMSYIFMTS